MPIITIPSIEINATAAQITRTIKGLEMTYGRSGAETDLVYVKRIFTDILKEAYRRKRDEENTVAAITANQENINPV